ncbi:MAG: PAS domain-containing protein [Planctomycetaceae bacterium]|nr:PAS domain-containing protein [Planctomycetaceae bacterium]
MVSAPFPVDEHQRIESLRQCKVLDTENEKIFDDLTRMAARLCDTPIALISLVDTNRQWFKSAFGLEAKETPREWAICAHSILRKEPLVIADASTDPRTSDNPLVTGPPHIRFYAGIPLESSDGLNLGTLCVIDEVPRTLSQDQLEYLKVLASQASSLLELKRTCYELEQKQHDLTDSDEKFAQLSAQLPGVVYRYLLRADGSSCFPFASEGIREIYRVSPNEVRFDATPVFDVLHPDDRRQVAASIERSARTLEPWKHEYRVLFPDNTVRWLSGNATPTLQPDRSILWHGFITDITQQRQERDEAQRVRSQHEAVINSSTQVAIIATDLNGIITVFNTGAERMLGYTATELVGKATPERIHLRSEVVARGEQLTRETGRLIQGFDAFVESARQGRHDSREWTYIRKDGSHLTVDLVVTAIRDADHSLIGFLGVASDVTASRKIAQELHRERERLELALSGGDLGTWDWNVVDRIKLIDSHGMAILGEQPRQFSMTLEDWESRVHPDDLPQRGKWLDDHFAERTDIYDAKYRMRKSDGTWVWVVSRGRVVERSNSGQPLRMVGTLADVTAKMQADRRSKESESRFRTLAASAPIGIFKSDINGQCVYANECWQVMWGLKQEASLGESWTQTVHADDQTRIHNAWKQFIKEGGDFEEEFRCVPVEDDLRYIRLKARPVYSETGDCIGFVGCSEDITSTREAEMAIREQNEWFRQLTGSLPQLTWTCLPDGPCDYLSRQWVEYTGIPEEAQLPYGWLDQLYPDDRELTIQLWQEHVGSGEPFETQFRIRGVDGTYRWFQTRAVPIRDANGAIVKWLGSNTDIQAIRASEERYELAVRGSGAGLWDWDLLTGTVFYSPRFREMLGYSAEEFPGRFESFFDALHPDDRPSVQRHLDAHFANPQTPYSLEYRLKSKSGEYRNFLANGEAIWNKDGNPYRMSGSIVDVTDRVHAEQELKATAELLREFIRHTPAAVAILDRELCYIQASERWIQDYGLSNIEIIGKSHYEIFPEIPDRWKEVHQRVLAGATEACSEDCFVRSDGKEEWLQWEVRPWWNSLGQIGGVIFFKQLITERKRAERELIDARIVADSANQSKSDFLANMSHEIRTPLTAILGYVELLSDRNLTDEIYNSYLQTIARSGEHLLKLINDILDLSKIEAGRMTVERVSFSPIELVEEVLGYFREMAAAKELCLTARVDGCVPKTICSDPVRLRQILVNLVGNAIKFTETGSVGVVVRVQDANNAKSSKLAFDVCDTGIGLSEEQQKDLFQPFIQADSSTTRKFGGTGLGLSVSRRMARLLDGDVSVESVPGKGSRFTATVDAGPTDNVDFINSLESTSQSPVDSSTSISLSGHILLAEDSPLNQRLFSTFLEAAGATVDIVEDGQQAIQKVSETLNPSGETASRSYDLILMDMQMPEVDGCTATSTLRAQGFSRPIVALTANAMHEDRKKCIQAGCNDFLIKPIARTELLSACRDWISRGKLADDSPALRSADVDSSMVFDRDAMSRLVRGDMQLFTEIVSLFHDDTSRLLKRAEEAVQENKPELLAELAHRLKGVCGAIHAESAFQAAHRLEILARERDMELIETRLINLVHEIRRLTPCLDNMKLLQATDEDETARPMN